MITMTEFYTKHVKIKNANGTFSTPVLREGDKEILEALDNGKKFYILRGRTNKIVLV